MNRLSVGEQPASFQLQQQQLSQELLAHFFHYSRRWEHHGGKSLDGGDYNYNDSTAFYGSGGGSAEGIGGGTGGFDGGAYSIWDSQEMMAFINETLLGTSSSASLAYDMEEDIMMTDPFINGSRPFGGDYFKAFQEAYFPVHGYLAIIISIFGIVSNVINIAVLSQKNMVTPTNAILTALALVDVLVMLTYVPFALHQYILKGGTAITPDAWRSYGWMVFICFNINFTIVCHTISVWLTITLAVFRYIAITFPAKVQDYCSMKRAIMGIVMAFICTAVICTPSYLSVQVSQMSERDARRQMDWIYERDGYVTMYRIDESDLSKNNSNIPRIISFYAFSVLAKLVPCVVLTWLSIQLVRALVQAERRRFQLKNPNGLPPRRLPAAPGFSTNGSGQRGSLAPSTKTATEATHFLAPPPGGTAAMRSHSNSLSGGTNNTTTNKQAKAPPAGRDRTTRMLLAILVCFLITEFPSGLVALFSCFSPNFFSFVYGPLGDLMDILALINSSVNFILYCSMSRQFRKTFCHMFVPRNITQWWKGWKVRRYGGTLPVAMTERTVTYYPVITKTTGASKLTRDEDMDES
ncbi:putative Sex peptide receptor [Hypsibius exemplaris]|uniref:Sex peptide receptor n=1 Tax=Hypsibius exemplaris TaxID=2072580 RepID=A0A9X6NJN8_HYPEX|nr:putative Sex peptide receptor [Hypsibius exemplaris]